MVVARILRLPARLCCSTHARCAPIAASPVNILLSQIRSAAAAHGAQVTLIPLQDTLDPTKKFRSKDGKWIGAPRDGTPETADTDAATDRIPDVDTFSKADSVKNRFALLGRGCLLL